MQTSPLLTAMEGYEASALVQHLINRQALQFIRLVKVSLKHDDAITFADVNRAYLEERALIASSGQASGVPHIPEKYYVPGSKEWLRDILQELVDQKTDITQLMLCGDPFKGETFVAREFEEPAPDNIEVQVNESARVADTKKRCLVS